MYMSVSTWACLTSPVRNLMVTKIFVPGYCVTEFYLSHRKIQNKDFEKNTEILAKIPTWLDSMQLDSVFVVFYFNAVTQVLFS